MGRQRGLTLIEVVIVLAIMGILMAAGAPSFQAWLNSVQIRNAAEAVQNGIQLARMEAMRRNDRVSFWMVSLDDLRIMDNSCARSATGASWVVSRTDPAGACAADASDEVAPRIIQKKAAGDGARSVSVSATDAANAATSCITFDGFGRPLAACSGAVAANPIARVQIDASGGRKLEVRVSSGGVIRMCDPDPTVASSDPRHC